MGASSAGIESLRVPGWKRNKAAYRTSGVVDNRHLQLLIVLSTDSTSSSTKPTTCSKVAGRNEKKAGENVEIIARSYLVNYGLKNVDSVSKTPRRAAVMCNRVIRPNMVTSWKRRDLLISSIWEIPICSADAYLRRGLYWKSQGRNVGLVPRN